jgi:trehalose utilization protein
LPEEAARGYPEQVNPIRVTIWNEFLHEKQKPAVAAIYPRGIHETLREALAGDPRFQARVSTLDLNDQGLSDALLSETDVLVYWAHGAHDQVLDATVDRIHKRILDGMGFVPLHSAHWSKIFKRLMGTTCALRYREAGEKERVWNINPGHPIAEGVPDYFEIPESEMYGEPFGIPQPDEQLFISWFAGGEVFRSGNCWFRGSGRIFYFSPGHESYPIYHHPMIQRIIANGIAWAKPQGRRAEVPLHVMPENAPEPLQAKGPQMHDSAGKLL